MPRLTPVQWLLFLVFLGFYGFAVFALTRDYYIRNPPRVASVPAQAPRDHSNPSQPTWIQTEMRKGLGGDLVPLEGRDTALLHRQGDELFAAKRYEEAIGYYRRVLELDPSDSDALNDLGLSLHYRGRSTEALEVLRRGAEGAPDFQRIWLTLGFVLASTGDASGARGALEKARELGPDNGVGQEAQRLLGLLSP